MIVCAALRYPDGTIVIGPRHFDSTMQAQMHRLTVETTYVDYRYGIASRPEQGFIDQNGDFLDRRNAWIEAEKCEQIRKRVGGDTINGGTLFSENLY